MASKERQTTETVQAKKRQTTETQVLAPSVAGKDRHGGTWSKYPPSHLYARPLGNGQPGPEPKSSRRATASRAPNPGEALEKRKKLLDSPIICSCCLPGCFSPPTPCVFFSFLHPREGLQPGRGCRAFSNYFSSPSTVHLVFSRTSASQTHAHTVVPTNIEQF